jgi:hypothetical protein
MNPLNLMTRPGRLGLIAVIVVGIATLSLASRSDAGFVISVADVTATAGSSGSFDVLISNTNSLGGASYSVGSDVLELALTGISGVTFTGVTIDTTTPYIYLTSGTTLGGGPLSFDNFPNTGFTASDSEFSPLDDFQQTIAPGMSFGLAHVSYNVAAGTAPGVGLLDIVVNADGSATSLSDASGNNVPFTTLDGSFTVTPSVVPEPSTILLTATGFALVLLGRGRARSIDVGRGKTQHSEEVR